MTASPKRIFKTCPFKVGDVVDFTFPHKGWPFRLQGSSQIVLVLGPEDLIELEAVCRFNGPRTKIGQKSGCFRVAYVVLDRHGIPTKHHRWLTETAFKSLKTRKVTT